MSIKEIDSICTYCGVGCEITAVVENNTIKRIYAKKDTLISRGKLCIKGKAGWDFVHSSLRLPQVKIKKDFIRKNELYFPKDVKEALLSGVKEDEKFIYPDLELSYKIVAWKLQRVRDLYGSDSIAGIGGARSSCESGYLFQKFIREVILSPHIDNCARVCHAPSLKGMREVIGEGAATNPFDDIEKASFILVFGSNTTEAHPIAATRITNALRSGAKTAVFDVRETHISASATYDCTLPFESNLLVLNMLSYVILSEELYDKDFINDRTTGFNEYKEAILKDEYANPEFFKKIKGYEYLSDMIKTVAREYAKNRSVILWGLGVTEHLDGSYAVEALCNLAVMTGNIGKEGAGLIPLRGQNNVQGVCDVGCLPYFLPDYKTPQREGKKTPEMVKAMMDKEIRVLINMGEDIAHIHPNQNKIKKALEGLDFLVVLDLFENETTEFADVIYGVKSAYEKEGVYVNAERRVQLSSVLVESELPDDWEVIDGISKEMGEYQGFNSSKEVWDDLRKGSDRFLKASYEFLRANQNRALQWPIDDKGATEILHTQKFRTNDAKAHFSYRRYYLRGMVEELIRGKEIRFYLTTGRAIAQYNNANQTGKSKTLTKRHKEDVLHISLEDKEYFKDAKYVVLSSKHGKTKPLKYKLTRKLKKGTMFCTFHHFESRINHLFGDESDELTKTALFKSVKVDAELVYE
ncbi:MAG: molybdopterin-dependent oxidoreductase [Epsilonproteobacteria bacterium]|nr:molybdopterin-dependent oxidoreductase [Campylobacterota bacterium]